MESFNWGSRFGTVELSQEERSLRRKFVKEYLRDYNAMLAVARIGFESAFVETYAAKFMSEPYTLSLILETERKSKSTEQLSEQRVEDSNLALATLRDVAVNGTPSARVRAATQLALLYDVAPSLKLDSGISSGIMIVPGIADISNWEESARQTQNQLMAQSAMD